MLYLVATPIGDTQEITLRALELLKNTETIICESTKETSILLKRHGITGKTYEVLDEHSKPEDLKPLVELCKKNDVVLVSDCGTPGFCDPGAELVHECRRQGVQVKSVLGPSALMGLISLSGMRLERFLFRGFLPAENTHRAQAIEALKKEKQAVILMDTPYRLQKTLTEMKNHWPNHQLLLALNLSQENEQVFAGTIDQILKNSLPEKAEFMLLIKPAKMPIDLKNARPSR
jgi:16S rRNA (cytidine1402-2'-O)-methyltransferase